MKRLLIRPGAIGDFILSLPALESLRDVYTEAWVSGPNVPLVRFADRVRSIAGTGLDWLEIPGREAPPALLETLHSFDSIISWYGANRAEFRDAVRRLALPFQFFDALPAENSRHAVDFYLDQARRLGGRPTTLVPTLGISSTRRERVVIHPFSGSAAKNWALENFRALAERIEATLPVEWCAGPEEALDGAHRFDDLFELASWLAGARLYVGNDSGVTHLAAAAGTPVVAIFGPTDEFVWGPRGKQVDIVTPSPRGAGLESVTPNAVHKAVQRRLV